MLDAEHFLYTVVADWGGSYFDAQTAVLSLRTGESKVVLDRATNARYAAGHVVFSRSGGLFAAPFDVQKLNVTGAPMAVAAEVATSGRGGGAWFSVANDGTLVYLADEPAARQRQLVWVDRRGTMKSLSDVEREYDVPRLSPDGKRLVVEVENRGGADLWVYGVSRKIWTRLTKEGDNLSPVWSPDGHTIAFGSQRRGGVFDVYLIPSDGSSAPTRLTRIKDRWAFPTSWSSDGSTLAITSSGWSGSGQVVEVMMVDMRRNALLPVTMRGQDAEFSPDGRWILLQSDETGRVEVYLAPYPFTGRKWPVSTAGGFSPRWRRDGREVFYRSGDTVAAVPVQLRLEPVIGSARTLFRTDIEADYGVTGDGQRFVMLRSKQKPAQRSRLEVITGFFDNLVERK